jgi:hypothetical protein
LGDRIDSGNKIAHALEILRDRGQFNTIAVGRGDREPRCQTNTWALDDPPEFAQPGCAGAVPELGGGGVLASCRLRRRECNRELVAIATK